MMQLDAKHRFAKNRSWQFLGFFIVLILIAVGVVFHFFRNYAAEAARPLEAALVKAGGEKECSRGDAGIGPDNTKPWYFALYQLPGDREAATELVRAAAKEAGYSLKDGPAPVNPEDNKFYSDQTSKKSPYSDLKPGNIDLRFTVLGSSTYTGKGDRFCTETRRENPPHDKTTVDFTVTLPEFGR